ncbi:hypothetical protein BSKO_01906 [Bryopsis sp. KO-2023]|nr:hypothetical protein BSKO_01906 [Bryopsis sp. KO-2023]
MLLIQDLPLDCADEGRGLLNRILAFPGIATTASEFLSRRCTADQFADRKSLFILQKELARVDVSKDPDCVLSSAEATTCVIGVAICRETESAAVCHFDEGSKISVQQWLEGMSKPTIYLVGAYDDERGTGPFIASEILTHLHASRTLMATLALVCMGHLNTQSDGFPRCCDLAVDVANGMAYPLGLDGNAPKLMERHARFYCLSEHKLRQVYDPSTQRIVAKGYDASINWYTRGYFERLLSLPDASFLLSASTSPAHEGPQFVPNLRKLFAWLLSLPSECCQLPTEEYAWCSNDCIWKLAGT